MPTTKATWPATGSATWAADGRPGYEGGNVALDLYWRGDTDAVASKVANWSETAAGGDASQVPDLNDPVHFTSDGDEDCTLDSDVRWGSISSPDGYTSTFDWNDNTITLANGGDCTFAASGGVVDCGSGSLVMLNGDFDNSAVGTWTRGTSEIVMGGVGTLTSASGKYLTNLTIVAGATITSGAAFAVLILGAATINGTYSVGSGHAAYLGRSTGGTLLIGSSGNLTGLGAVEMEPQAAGTGLTSFASGGVIDVATLAISYPSAAATPLPPQTYGSALVKIKNTTTSADRTLTLLSGSYVFSGDLEFENSNVGAGQLIVANDTHDPDIECQGDIIWDNSGGGSIVYAKGTGDLTASGGSDQDWDFGGSAIEDLTVNKSAGYLLFSEDCDPDSITQTAGEIKVTGGKTLTVAGNCVFNDDLTGVTSAFTLSVAGTNRAYNSTVTNCTCDDTNLTALLTDGCTDGGGNTNVDFT